VTRLEEAAHYFARVMERLLRRVVQRASRATHGNVVHDASTKQAIRQGVEETSLALSMIEEATERCNDAAQDFDSAILFCSACHRGFINDWCLLTRGRSPRVGVVSREILLRRSSAPGVHGALLLGGAGLPRSSPTSSSRRSEGAM